MGALSGIRLIDTAANRPVVVDTASRRSWADLNGDGRIDAAEALSGTANEGVQRAADEWRKWFMAPIPGTAIPGCRFVVAAVASPREINALANGGSIVAGRSKLAQHLDFFDDDGDGKLSPAEIFRGFRRVGAGVLTSLIKAAASAIIFGGFRNGLQVDIDAIAARRRPGATGVYDADGNIDPMRLSDLAAEFHAKGGTLTARQLHTLLGQRRLGAVSKRQFGSLAAACMHINGTRTITARQVADFYEGSLLWRIASLTNQRGRRAL